MPEKLETKSKKPRVLVGCPTADAKDYCLQEYIDAVKNLTYDNYDILLIDNSKTYSYAKKIKSLGINVLKTQWRKFTKDRVIESRNILREKTLEKYDYFLSLEQDVIPPRDIIERLLHWKRIFPDKIKIISGIVFHLFPKDPKNISSKEMIEKPLLALKSKKEKNKLAFFTSEQIANVRGLAEVDYCSMGCLLISREVLEKIKFRYEEFENKDNNPDNLKWDDICFCSDSQKLGYKIYADLGAKCLHRVLGGYSITIGNTHDIERELKFER